MQAAIKGSQKIALCGVADRLGCCRPRYRSLMAADACAGSTPENHELAIDTMALFTPLITITDTDSLLRDLQTD